MNAAALRILTVTAALLSCPLFCAGPSFAAYRAGYSIEVLVDGVPLTEYAARGTTYVEARRHHEYALRISNQTAGRIAVALTVDGLNTIDARRTSARGASKWVIGPWQSITIEGWQTNESTARRFFFTSEKKSYGAWLGQTADLGVIAAAVFRERPAPPPVTWYRAPGATGYRKDAGDAQPGAPSAGVPREESTTAQSRVQEGALAKPQDDLAATGIGERVDHPVENVDILLESTPAAVFQLRYEYHDALVRLGVLPQYASDRERALDRREHASGFASYCPDPFAR